MKRLILNLCFSFSLLSLNAQVYLNADADKIVKGSKLVAIDENTGTIKHFSFPSSGSGQQYSKDVKEFLESKLSLPGDFDLEEINSTNDKFGKHIKYQFTYKKIPIDGYVYGIQMDENKVLSANGDYKIPKEKAYKDQTKISEEEALSRALDYVKAKTYQWDVDNNFTKPVSKLFYIEKNGELVLVYQFDIYSAVPLSRQYIYINVENGEVEKTTERIHIYTNASGTAVTKYQGTKSIKTDYNGGTYRLRENSRGNGIETYDLNNGTSYGSAVDFTDADNYWNTTANQDNAAYDAHYGSEATYDYYFNKFGRNSIDGAGFSLKSYVHYSSGYVNAYWNGSCMTYGDGDGSSYTALTSIDIVAHEITHGLTEHTSNLNYSYESGALNESFSDIFGTAIDFYANPTTANYLMGDQISISGTPFRSMINPNLYDQPDTYLGTYWYTGSGDNGGVHYNSGVQNYWFYLLCVGGSGTNDNGNAFSVSPIGMDKAAAIAYKTLTVYLTPTSQYADARYYSIQSALDLYGECSPEVINVTNAWYAVGVGAAYSNAVVANFRVSQNYFCTYPATVQFTNTSINATTYSWNFGDGTSSTLPNPIHTYNSIGNYTVTLISAGVSACSTTDTLVSPTPIIVTNTGGPVSATCTPTTVNTTGVFGIINFTFNGIYNSTSGSSDSYKDYTCNFSSTLTEGLTYNYSITTGTSNLSMVKIWIDLNNDGQFNNTNELLVNASNITTTKTGIINIPHPTIYNTPLRLRIASDMNSGSYLATACTNSQYGQYEDYSVIIHQNSLPPVAKFAASTTSVNTGQSVSFTDSSLNLPTSWVWTFPGGTPSTSTLQNPVITYNTLGTYPVKLKVQNSYGHDSIEKTSYIKVVNTYNMCSTTSTVATEGILYDSGGPTGDYQNYENCSFLIDPGCATSITLTFTAFNTENGWDYFTVYDGSNSSGTQLLRASGSTLPSAVTASTGKMFITFTTDGSAVRSGFQASWTSLIPTSNPPVVNFSISNYNPPLNTVVQFTDLSANFPNTWLWNFGDGSTSTLKNPTHTFNTSGNKLISLTASNCYGSRSHTDTIFVQGAPVINVNPASLSKVIRSCDDSIYSTLFIKNTGGGNLIWNWPGTITSVTDDFDPAVDNSVWQSITGGVAANTCGYHSAPNSLYFNVSSTREAITKPINTSSGGTINFYLEISGGTTPCEQADPGENVILSYSTNGGSSWVNIQTYLTGSYSSFTSISEIIPVGAKTSATLFKWSQPSNSGPSCDNWSIDDVSILFSSITFYNLSPQSGIITPGDSTEVSVEMKSYDLRSGHYSDSLMINSNDPLTPVKKISCELTVVGSPEMVLSDTCLNFGELFSGLTKTDTLFIFNSGCDTLSITNITSSLREFTVDKTDFIVFPYDTGVVVMSFTPTSIGLFNANLEIFTNDVDTVLSLTGEGIAPPIISISPDSLFQDLNSGDSGSQLLTISNSGESDLNYDISIEGGKATAVNFFAEESIREGNVVAVGKPIKDLSKQITSFPNQTNVGLSDFIDMGSPFTKNTSMNEPIKGTEGEEVFGSDENEFLAGTRSRGNLFTCTTSTTLIEHRFYLNPSASTKLWFLVYEGESQTGIYNLISASDLTPTGPGLGWYSSGDVNVPLVAGKYYLIVASFEASTYYYNKQNISPFPIPASFGELTAGAGWEWSPTSNFPPDSSQSVTSDAFGSPVAYYQTLLTGSGTTWLTVNPTSGTIPAGSSTDIEVTFDATGLDGGEYDADIVISSNDPDKTEVVVPVHLNVTGIPNIAVLTDTLIYNPLYRGVSVTDTLVVSNNGTDILTVTDIISNKGDFTIDSTNFNLNPGESQNVLVTFTPGSVGVISGTLTITSNDPDEPTKLVSLQGEGLLLPHILVIPDPIDVTIAECNDSITLPMTIYNTGGSDLTFEIAGNSVGTVELLALTYGVDYDQEYQNTLSAIDLYYTDYHLTEINTTSATALQTALTGKDVLLIAEQEVGSASVFTGFASVLQTFVNNGGTVIFCGTNNSGCIFNTGLFAGSYISYTYGTLLNVLDSNHPITDQVSASFTASDATYYYDITNTDAVRLVGCGDYDAVTCREVGRGKAVYIGFDYWAYENNAARIIANAVKWGGKGSLPTWIELTTLSGTISSGDSINIGVEFNSTGLNEGMYIDSFTVISNDPLKPIITVACSFTVNGAPEIALSDTSLNFGELFSGLTKTDTLLIFNSGCDTLSISNITSSLSEFTVDKTFMEIIPGDTGAVFVSFAPISLGNFNGNLSIYSNDVDTVLPLTGEALAPPNISFSPDSLFQDLNSGDSAKKSLTISNNGGSNLNYTISIEDGENVISTLNFKGVFTNEISSYQSINDNYEVIQLKEGEIQNGISNNNLTPVFYSKPINSSFKSFSILGEETRITFDDVSAPGFFINTIALSDEYEDFGILFNGPTAISGGAILNETGNFSVTGYSPPNFLAFNLFSRLSNGGIPQGPETMTFIDPVSFVSMNVGSSNGGTVVINAYNSLNNLVATNSLISGSVLQNLNVSAPGIVRVEISFTGSVLVLDDLRFMRDNSLDWLSVNVVSGNIPTDTSAILEVSFNAAGLNGGNYDANIVISSNDPDEPEVVVPAHLHVTGIPNIVVLTDTLIYSPLYRGVSVTDTLIVSNNGTDILAVSDIICNNDDFTIDSTIFNLNPGESQNVLVTFTPGSVGLISGTLAINSNDPDAPTKLISLQGEGLLPPDILVIPDPIDVTIADCKDSITLPMTIYNRGGDDLIFDLLQAGTTSDDFDTGIDFNFWQSVTGGAAANTCGYFSAPNSLYFNTSSTRQAITKPLNTIAGGNISFYLEISGGSAPCEGADAGENVILSYSTNGGSTWVNIQTYLTGGYPTFKHISETIPVGARTNATLFKWSQPVNTGVGFDNWSIDNVSISIVLNHLYRVSPTSGTLIPGDSSIVAVTFNSTELNEGLYNDSIIINSNDPDMLKKKIECTLNVIKTPEITFSDSCLQYGRVLIGLSKKDTLLIFNEGCDTLFVNNITSSLEEFSVDKTDLIIEPGDTGVVYVSFEPSASTIFDGILTINSNDVDTTLCLSGSGLEPPVISISPDSLVASISECNDSITLPLTIFNTGGCDLIFDIEHEISHNKLTTTYVAGNKLKGNMFNIHALSAIKINQFDIHLNGTSSYPIEIYYRRGGYEGYETNASAWTMLLSTSVTGKGLGNPTSVNISDFLISSGETYGFYINSLSGDLRYTNGSNSYSDYNISIQTGVGLGSTFGSIFTPRTWNGSVHYTCHNLPGWLTVSSESDTIISGGSTEIGVTFSSLGLKAGNYFSNFIISSNDIETPFLSVPVHFLSNTTPNQPSVISGNATVNAGRSELYNVINEPGVTYNWSASGGTIYGSGNSVRIIWNTTGVRVLTVTPLNSCGTGLSRTLNVTVYERPIIPEEIAFSDTVISNLESACFNAYDTIRVAGTSSVLFESGSSVDLIAGKAIFLLPGFKASEGSNTHAYITTDSTFCDGAYPLTIVDQPEDKSIDDEDLPEKQAIFPGEKSVKVFPNPNNGQFTLELTNIELGSGIAIYNVLGIKVYQSLVLDAMLQDIDLAVLRRGLYFVKVTDGKDQLTRKIVVE